ncbi:hypothetical protein JXQ70_17640 [bacterium]|nr:hypothetical protein [bacterium]
MMDNLRDFPRILDFHLKAGRRAFALFGNAQWQEVRVIFLNDYHVEPVWVFHDGYIAEISE